MSRYIDADKLIGELHSLFLYDGRDRSRVYAKIQEQPTADVVPRERFDKVMDNLKAVLEERNDDWIPVEKGLPPDGAWILVTNGKSISVERYKMDLIDHFFPSGRWYEWEDVVAWMPLPQPWKEVKK